MPQAADDYKASVEGRGGYFFSALPANVPGISPADVGKPGARFPAYSATRTYRYEVAPSGTMAPRAAGTSLLDRLYIYAADNPLGLSTFDEDLQGFADGAALGQKVVDKLPTVPSLLDVLAAALGISKPVLVLILAFVAYAALRNIGVVPPLKTVFA